MKKNLLVLLCAGFLFGACGSSSNEHNLTDSSLTDSVDTGFDATGTPPVDSVTTDDRNDTMGGSAGGNGSGNNTGSQR